MSSPPPVPTGTTPAPFNQHSVQVIGAHLKWPCLPPITAVSNPAEPRPSPHLTLLGIGTLHNWQRRKSLNDLIHHLWRGTVNQCHHLGCLLLEQDHLLCNLAAQLHELLPERPNWLARRVRCGVTTSSPKVRHAPTAAPNYPAASARQAIRSNRLINVASMSAASTWPRSATICS